MFTLKNLAALYETHKDSFVLPVAEIEINGKKLSGGATPHLMGVINLSQDSWYRESICNTLEGALKRGKLLTAQGASIIDIGAESTLAQADIIPEEKQKQTLLPIVKELSQEGIIVSVETYHPSVAQSCLEAGAKIINLTSSENLSEIFSTIAAHDAAVILCFVQGKNPRQVKELKCEGDPTEMFLNYFTPLLEKATSCGVKNIWIDPALGFYYSNLQDSTQRVQYQMYALLSSFRLKTLGYPICHALPHAFDFFAEEARSAESLFAVLAFLGKCDLLRTHEVSKICAVTKTLEAFPSSSPHISHTIHRK